MSKLTQEELARNLRLVLRTDVPVFIEKRVASGKEIAKINEFKSEDGPFIVKVMGSLGFVPTQRFSESASAFGVLEFERAEDESDSTKSSPESTDSRLVADTPDVAGRRDIGIDGDGRSFRVLVDPESHKFANKVWQQMLGNDGGDMSKYGSFLYDFDGFLGQYQGENPPDDEEDDEAEPDDVDDTPAGPQGSGDDDEYEEIIVRKKKKQPVTDIEATEEASAPIMRFFGKGKLGLIEAAGYMVNTYGHVATMKQDKKTGKISKIVDVASAEVAKKKKKDTGRGALLSALMTALSGSTGEKAVKAWDERDSGDLAQVLGEAIDKVLDKLPEPDKSDAEGDNKDGGKPFKETNDKANENVGA